MLSAPKIINALFNSLADRQKEVIVGRFGLKSGEGETLAAIGDTMGITRERVRQIEKSALGLLNKEVLKNSVCVHILNQSKKQLKNAGGVMRQDVLLQYGADFAEGLNKNYLALLLEASGAFYFYPEDENYHPFYYLTKDDLRTAVGFIDGWADNLKSNKNKVLSGDYKTLLTNFIKTEKANKNHAENYLNITKKIGANPYGDVGLRDWAEINPTTTRDRIYLVLRKTGQPLHFQSIAKVINETSFGSQEALAPTVHNELIKDERFVLVGRGMYGLREHGYEPGVAREVIQKVLKKNGPLHPNDVVQHVNKQRFFKPNTVIINLQNKDYFERLSDGRYRVRES
ncbi:MAG: hypothetical protein KGJ89_02505 [Patescibacteria group bacterium]|nr:hypothetical protein [Patescibacteria group bacterium]MDE2015750.1 hypothetical protein [Patescibacteria group bacterium]MDE2226807.1 hypothetical protein [Patescibacteria group bacterium]